MTRRLAWIPRFLLLVALATAGIAEAQHSRSSGRAVTVPDLVTILQTTDIHDHANGSGHVGLDVDPSTATSVTGAYSRISAYVNSVRATAGHPVILVDSGDWTMGTLYDLTLGSSPLALYFLNALRYDAVTLGNHEFDYTPRGLAGMIVAARATSGFQVPIVASNMNVNGNSDLAPLFGNGRPIQPLYLETLPRGMKVGFIGLMGEDAAVDAPASAPVSFSPLSSHYADIQKQVDFLRKVGAQLVIALSHSGTNGSGTAGEDVELARHVRGIDVIASGHTHTPLAAVHGVKNGSWTTQIIDAGAFGTNVARLDLRIDRATGTVTPAAFSNVPMTDAGLAAARSGLRADPTTTAVVAATDQQLNAALAPVLSQAFADYSPSSLGKGIYHPAAFAAQDMIANNANPVLSPNGLGDLAADSVRNVPNAIVSQTFAGGLSNFFGYDFTPYQVGLVATGVIRSNLPAGVPLTFADIYNVLPLGISPDQTQALPVGYPLMSVYVDLADLKKICALQLVGQSNLVGSSFYLNFSGISYTLKSAQTYTYFKYATAAEVLSITSGKAASGSVAAQRALLALGTLGSDQGSALLTAYAGGNPYAAAMVKLNDATPDAGQIGANLGVVGQVATAGVSGGNAVSSLVVSKAIDAIDTIYGFAPEDVMNTGTATPLSGALRIRAAVDLYALLLINAIKDEFGIAVTPYQNTVGSTVLSPADMTTLLGNRIDASPATPGVQELKEWMALLSNVGTGLGGKIGPEYASTPNFSDFPKSGAAVRTRNASYPLAAVAQLAGNAAVLQQSP